MKKQLLTLLFASLSIFANSQTVVCDTDLMNANSSATFGAWPNPQTNLDHATVGQDYEQLLHFKVPTDAGMIDPNFAGATINYFSVVDVEGLPSNFTYKCNVTTPDNCRFNGGTWGCAQLYNTSEILASQENSTGIDVTIKISANVKIGMLPAQNVPYSFTGYKLFINPGLGVNNLSMDVSTLFPNPAGEFVNFDNLTDVNQINFYSVAGELVKTVTPTSEVMQINVLDFKKGTYLVYVLKENSVHVMKLIKD